MRWKNSNRSVRLSNYFLALVTLGLVLQFSLSASAWKDSEDIDFEFDDLSQEKNENRISGHSDLGKSFNKWNKNTLCKNLQCKPHQTCIIKSENVAVCISKKKYSSNIYKVTRATTLKPIDLETTSQINNNGGDSSDEEEETDDPRNWPESSSNSCQACPVIKPDFVCGSDNQTYSSECRMQYHNCVHKTDFTAICKGFCPCKDSKSDADFQKEEKMKERWNVYMSKFQNTLNKIKWPKSSSSTSSSTAQPASESNNNNNSGTVLKFNIKNKSIGDKNTDGLNKGVQKKSCNRSDLKMMGDRLLDWFSVVMSDHQKPHPSHKKNANSMKVPSVCKPEVKWMFQHLDSDGDVKLSLRELYDLEHDDREQCLQPYLSDCDANRDLYLSIREWCSCFEMSRRPCIAAQERAPEPTQGGSYVPQCDQDGYYKARQCHTSVGTCWCVDKHGVEFTNTRRRGYPDCASLLKRGHHKLTPNDDDEDSEDSYEEEEGSADKPLDF